MKREGFLKTALVLGIIFILPGAYLEVFSQESTKNNYTGGWTDNNSWTDGSAIGTTNLPPAGYNITIHGYITVGSYGSNQDLTFAPNNEAYDFVIGQDDTLVVYGNVDFGNKAMNLVIESGGLFIILGDLNMNNKIDIASDGNLIVQGTFNKTGTQGSYTGTGNVYAGSYTGDASNLVPDGQEKDTGSDLQADLPDVWEFLNDGGSTPLPVVLVYFKGIQTNSSVRLSWQTASELNNDHFTIERSVNGSHFETIANITGAGTTNETRDYEFTDENPYTGFSYYRLKQTDFDGTTEIFKPISVSVKDLYSTVRVYPNPILNDELKVFLTGLDNDTGIMIKILNLNGSIVFEKFLIPTNSINHFEKLDTGFLPKGNYIVNLSSNQFFTNIKLTKK